MPDPVSDPSIIHLLISKLLDWPILLFASLWVLVKRFGKEILEVLTNRKVQIEIAGTKLSIGEAIEEVQQDATDASAKLNARIEALENGILKPRSSLQDHGINLNLGIEKLDKGLFPDDKDVLPEKDRSEVIFQRMLPALAESKFRWRSVERLAIAAGVSESEAHEILAAHNGKEIVLGKGKSGNVIARLFDR